MPRYIVEEQHHPGEWFEAKEFSGLPDAEARAKEQAARWDIDTRIIDRTERRIVFQAKGSAWARYYP